MTPLPDYSEFLKKPGVLEWVEKEWLKDPAMHDQHAAIVNSVISKGCSSVLEVGCGTGNVAFRLLPCSYIGIDANKDCIEYARVKNPGKLFRQVDVREYNTIEVDLVFSFGFLKHFGLHEWLEIFNRIASFGKYFIFDIPIAKQTMDDGVEHHHVWKDVEAIRKHIYDAGFVVIDIENAGSVEPVFICKKR